METIREKAMRAYLKGCDVTVVGASKYSAYKGVVVVIDTVNSAIDLQTPDKLLGYHFCDIRDIRFVGEPAEEEAVIADEEDPRLGERQYIIERQRHELSEEHGKVLDLMQQVGSLENQVLAMTRKETESKPISPDVAQERWEIQELDNGDRFIIFKDGGQVYTLANISDLHSGRPDQTATLVNAPELLEVLEKVFVQTLDTGGVVSISYSLAQRINEVIRKVRGN